MDVCVLWVLCVVR